MLSYANSATVLYTDQDPTAGRSNMETACISKLRAQIERNAAGATAQRPDTEPLIG